MKGEKRFETKIRKYLEDNDAYVVKYFANGFTKAGIPDLICTVNGYALWIEVKDVKGKPSELQLYNRKKIREAGGICLVLYPNQFEEFKELVQELLHADKCKKVHTYQYYFDKE